MANGGQIRYNVGFNIDKTGLNELTKILQNVQTELAKSGSMGKTEAEIQKTITAAKQLEGVLNSAWNSKLNQLDLSKVSSGIKSTFGSVQQLKAQMEASGASGAAAYNKVASAVLNTNLQLKQSNKLLDNMALTMANTVKWGITSSIFNKITGSIQEAWGYTKRLDSSLNDIRIVTDKSAESMQKFAKQANEAAKALGKGTVDYTDASLIYYQQGLSDEEVAARAEVTLKAANVTGQSTEEVSEQLTAVWNGYKVSAQEAELYVDKLAAVAASTAADLEELSTGMSKVASAANSMGVDIDQLNAQLATIVSVTRQAPESVGTALKTIYARLGDLAVDGEDEFGVALGTVSKTMEEMGIQILDEQGQMRDMGKVIEETAAKWNTWSDAQRQAAAVAMAGKRQYNNLIALFDNWDMYTESLNTSVDATGTLQKQQDIYMESVSAHLAQMKTEAEKTYDVLFDEELVKDFIDITTGALSIFNNYIEGLGGGVSTLIGLGSIVANIFHKQIGNALSSQLNNLQQFKDNARAIDLKEQFIKQGIANSHTLKGEQVGAEGVQKEFEIASRLLEVREALTQEQYNELTQMQSQVGVTENQIQYLSQSRNIAEQIFDTELATVQDFEERLELEEESLENRKQQLATVDRELNLYERLREDVNYTDDDSHYLFERVEALKNMAETQEEYILLDEAAGNIAAKNALTDSQRQAILNAQNRLLANQQNEVNLVRQGLEGARAVEDGTLDTLREQQRVREDIINQQIRQAERQQLINDAVKGMALLVNVGISLFGIIQTLNNEDLSFEEKLKQTATVLVTVLPMLISNFSSLKSIIPGIKTGLTQLVVAYGDTAAAAAASSQLASGATMGFGKAIKSLLPAIGSFMLAALPYILIIGAIGVAVYACVKAYNADAEAAKKAAEAAKHAAEAAEEAKNAYEELKSTIENWDKAVKGLEELTEGTKEYEEAIKNANTQAMEMIKNNKELAQYATRNSQGLITFQGMEKGILEAAKNKANMASAATNLSSIEANQAQLKSDRTDLIRSERIGHTVHTQDGDYFVNASNQQLSDVVDLMLKNGNSLTRDDLEDLSSLNGNDELIDSIMEAVPEIQILAQETANLNATNKLLREEALRTSLGADAEFAALSAEEQNAIASLYGEGLTDDKVDAMRDEIKKDIYQDAAFGGGNEDEIHRLYAEARGWTLSKDKSGDKAVYVDAEGNEHTVEDDTARAYLTEQKLASQIADFDVDRKAELTKSVTKLSSIANEKFGKELSGDLLGFLTGDDSFENLSIYSPEEIEKLKTEMQTAFDEVDFNAFGEGAKVEFLNSISTAFEEYDESAYWSGVAATAQESFSQISGALSSLYEGNALDAELVEELKTKYSELGKIQNENTYEYIQALEKIREIEDAKYRENKKRENEALKTEIEDKRAEIEAIKEEAQTMSEQGYRLMQQGYTSAGIDMLKKASDLSSAGVQELENDINNLMQQIAANDYSIKLSIEADLADDVDGAFGLADEFENIKGLITDDLKVSFDEAKEFIKKGYGEILTNAQETNEGVIQLNEEQTKAFIKNKEAELKVDKDEKIKELNTQKAMLTAQLNILQEELKAYLSVSEVTEDSDKTQAMNKALLKEAEYQGQVQLLNEELKKDNEQKVELTGNENEFYQTLSGLYQQDAENSMLADEDADKATETYHRNVINYYDRMHQAAAQYAAAVRAASAGQSVGDFTVQAFSGEDIDTTSELDAVNEAFENEVKLLNVQSLFDSDKWNKLTSEEKDDVAEKLAEDTQKRIDSLKSQLGSIDSAIAALNTSTLTFDKEYESIGEKTEENNEKNKDTVEILEDVYDRYRDINIILTTIEGNLSRIQKQQEKLTGKAYINNLQQQLNLLNEQVAANREKLKITQTEEAELIAVLANQGAQFNDAGQVTNYKALMEQKLAETNKIIDDYNKMSATEQETYKATMEASVASYEALVETFERFDELYTEEIPGLVDIIQETLDQAIELQIEQFNTEVQITLDLKQAEREWNDFQTNILKGLKEDDLVGQANLGMTQLDTYYGTSGSVSADIARLEELNNQASQMLNGNFGTIYGDNFAKLYEDMQAATQQLMTDMEAAEDIAASIYDNYLESIDKVIEGNDAVIEQYEYINNLLDHNVKLVELLGANEKSSMLADQYAQRNALNQQMISEHLANAQYYEEMMNSIDDKTSEEWQKWHEAWQSEVESLNSSIITAMENAAEAYTNAIDVAMQEMESAFTDGMGFDYIQDEWDLVNENADKYLDTINAAYEISSLENKFVSAINSTDNLSAQKKLRAAMEQEVKLLEEADQISQYDIDRANLKYELTLKQIALEEAQANKTTMKLRRDSQGNMSYVFAADQDEIAKAQQELADAENELYNFDKDAYKEKTEAVLKAEQDLQNKLREIWTNENLSEEQKLQYQTMIEEQYRDIIEANIAESEKAKQNLSNDTLAILIKNFNNEKAKAIATSAAENEANRVAVESMKERFKGLTNESIPTLEELSRRWGDGTTVGTITGDMNESTKRLVESIQSNFDTGMASITSKFAGRNGDPDNPSFVETIEIAMKACEKASNDFKDTIYKVAESAGIDIDKLKAKTDGLGTSTATLKDVLWLLTEENTKYINKVTGENGSLSAAQSLADKYTAQNTELTNINASMITYLANLDSMKDKAEAATKAANELAASVKTQAEAQAAANSGPSGVGSAGSVNESYDNDDDDDYDYPDPTPAAVPSKSLADAYDFINSGKAGNGDSRAANMEAAGFTPEQITQAQSMINEAYDNEMTAAEIKQKYNAYDTGGYTGDWHSSEGRIALLHEKEIVLNKMDTKNILDVVSMVREMTSSSLRGANGMMSGMMEALASITNNSTSNNQNVHITAEFPNVRVASEIEEAFNNLTNIASQHAFQY